MVAESTVLQGMKEICAYARRSESTLIKLQRTQGFPMAKVQGVWVSDRLDIDAWFRAKIASQRVL